MKIRMFWKSEDRFLVTAASAHKSLPGKTNIGISDEDGSEFLQVNDVHQVASGSGKSIYITVGGKDVQFVPDEWIITE